MWWGDKAKNELFSISDKELQRNNSRADSLMLLLLPSVGDPEVNDSVSSVLAAK